MPSTNKKLVLLLILVFLVGTGAGIILSKPFSWCFGKSQDSGTIKPYKPDYHAQSQKLIEEFIAKLDLNPEQQKKFDTIMDTARNDIRKLREKWCPTVNQIRCDTLKQIREILDENQKTKYNDWVKQHQQKLEKHIREKFLDDSKAE